jgi:predicted RNA binding protein YcfA (HicA-like mRNA interferase family)
VTARDAMNRLRQDGWVERPGRGRHVVFARRGMGTVIVPTHHGNLATGTLRTIYRDAGWQWPPRP